jgi:hypothetical protein
MNFKYMPELAKPWGYPACLLLMLGVAVFELAYFRRKGWLGRTRAAIVGDGPPARVTAATDSTTTTTTTDPRS